MAEYLKIYNRYCKIAECEHLPDDAGLADPDKKEIVVHKKQTKENKHGTTMHEAAHIILAMSGLEEVLGKEQTEGICKAFEYGLAPSVVFKTVSR